ncbi:MAG: alkaline phosphatase family protein [Angelakisella sp.]
MKKITALLLAVFLLGIGVLIGHMLPWGGNTKEAFVPVSRLTGDVESELLLGDIYPQLEQLSFQKDNDSFSGVSLSALVELAKPLSKNSTLLLIGEDGFTSELTLPLPEDCYICFTDSYGWEMMSLHHPQSANSKRIQEIVVVSQDTAPANGVAVISTEENLCTITPGQLRKRSLSLSPIKEGEATADYKGQQLQVKVYTTDRALPVSVLAQELSQNATTVMAIGRDGKTLYDDALGTLVYKGNTISYRKKGGREQIHDLSGIILDPPRKLVAQVYHDAVETVSKGEPTMVIYLDGLGYNSYRKAVDAGAFPFLSKNSLLSAAVTAYTPVTNAGMAQMITGVTAERSGIHTRDNREPQVQTIFDVVTGMGKTGILVEGNIGILKTSVPPILNMDTNDNGTDDEVFQSAMEQIEKKPDYIMIHFHGIDDRGHATGPLSDVSMAKMKETDDYLAALFEAFEGRIFVVSDHGMHKTTDGGGHGNFCYEDMIVPYFTVTGGKAK